jgi:hypothetical protein
MRSDMQLSGTMTCAREKKCTRTIKLETQSHF